MDPIFIPQKLNLGDQTIAECGVIVISLKDEASHISQKSNLKKVMSIPLEANWDPWQYRFVLSAIPLCHSFQIKNFHLGMMSNPIVRKKVERNRGFVL